MLPRPRVDGRQQEQTEFLASIRSGTPIESGLYLARGTMIAITG